jgi:hypothetical protein
MKAELRNFFAAFHDYFDDLCEYLAEAAERMQLKELKTHYKAEVS